MSQEKIIKVGDLVTLTLGEYNTVSNTYRVERKLETECILSHPLAPECFIIKKDDDLNSELATLKDPIEKCLYYAKKHRDYLNHVTKADLDSLCIYFVLKKVFSSKQRSELAAICGKIACIILGDNLSLAISKIKGNEALLDDYSQILYNNYKNLLENKTKIKAVSEKHAIFNIAGFILAQLDNF